MSSEAWRLGVAGQWQRLLLYPGGLSALVMVGLGWLVWRWLAPRQNPVGTEHPFDWLLVPLPLLALSLWPFAESSELRATLDLVSYWLLLDAPLLWAIGQDWRNGALAGLRAARWLVGLITGWPLLGLVGWIIASLHGGLLPNDLLILGEGWLGWLALALWLAGLLPYLQLGAWETAPTQGALAWALGARRLGHLALLAWLLQAQFKLAWLGSIWGFGALLLGLWLLLLGLTSWLRRYSQSQAGAWLWSGALVGLLGFGLSSWCNR